MKSFYFPDCKVVRRRNEDQNSRSVRNTFVGTGSKSVLLQKGTQEWFINFQLNLYFKISTRARKFYYDQFIMILNAKVKRKIEPFDKLGIKTATFTRVKFQRMRKLIIRFSGFIQVASNEN